jgi:hypothetical protein
MIALMLYVVVLGFVPIFTGIVFDRASRRRKCDVCRGIERFAVLVRFGGS